MERNYAAFISYRHADNLQPGRRWAEWLQQALETYEVPRDLVGKTNQRGRAIPAAIYPVFRDEEELPAHSDLTENIKRALVHSEILIVLCSPRACQSRFVADEIRHFKELGRGDRILALMLDGEPNASEDPAKQKEFGMDKECLPEPLRRGVCREDGTVDWSQRTEPIAADVRPGGQAEQGYTTSSAYRQELERQGRSAADLRSEVRSFGERLELARLKLIAGILGIPLGRLRERDVAHRARRFRRLATVFGLLALFAMVTGAIALSQRQAAVENGQRAEHQRMRAEDETSRRGALLREASRADVATAESLLRKDSWREGTAYLERALRYDPGNRSAQERLWIELLHGQGDRQPLPGHLIPYQSVLSGDLSARLLVTKGARAFFTLEELLEGHSRLDLNHGRLCRVSPDRKRTLLVENDTLSIFDEDHPTASVAARPWRTDTTSAVVDAVVSREFARLLVTRLNAEGQFELAVLDAKTGQTLAMRPRHDGSLSHASFVSGGTRVFQRQEQQKEVWDAITGKVIISQEGPGLIHEDVLYLLNAAREWQAWDVQTGDKMGGPRSYPVDDQIAFAVNEGILAAKAGHTVQRWRLRTGEPVGPSFVVEDGEKMLLSDDGTRTLILTKEKLLTYEQDGKKLSEIPLPNMEERYHAIHPAGKFLLAVEETTGVATLWNLETAQRSGNFPHSANFAPFFNPAGTHFLTSTGGEFATWPLAKQHRGLVLEHGSKVQGATFDSLGKHLLIVVENDEMAQKAMRENGGSAYAAWAAAQHTTHSLFWYEASQGRLINVWNDPGSATLRVSADRHWSAITRTLLPTTTQDLRWGVSGFPLPQDTDLMSSGSILATKGNLAAMNDGEYTTIWDLSTNQALNIRLEACRHLLFHPVANEFITLHKGELAFRATDSGHVRQRVAAPDLDGLVSISPDGRWMAAETKENELVLLDGQQPQEQRRLPPFHIYSQIAWHPTGQMFARYGNQEVSLHDTPDGRVRIPPWKHPSSIHTVQFHPDGQTLLIAQVNGTVQLHDATTGTPIGAPLPAQSTLVHASFSPDGRSILTASEGGRVQIWQTPSEMGPLPDWIRSAVACTGGYLFAPDGTLKKLSLAERLAAQAQVPKNAPSADGWNLVLEMARGR